jgi:hypothetical protein
VAEGGGLLNRYTVNSRIVGSNPIPSAILLFLIVPFRLSGLRKLSFSARDGFPRVSHDFALSHEIWGNKMGNGGAPPLSRTSRERKSQMARVGKLSAIEVQKAKGPAVLHDGGGLYLRVSPRGAKSWVFRFQLDGKRRDMGLGPYPDISWRRPVRKPQNIESSATTD